MSTSLFKMQGKRFKAAMVCLQPKGEIIGLILYEDLFSIYIYIKKTSTTHTNFHNACLPQSAKGPLHANGPVPRSPRPSQAAVSPRDQELTPGTECKPRCQGVVLGGI